MKNRLLVILSVACLCCELKHKPPTIDGSSEELFEASIKVVKQSLPPNIHKKFDQAWVIVVGDLAEKLTSEDPAAAQIQARAALHGKSGQELICAAEKIVASLIKAEQEREAKITAISIPSPLPVTGSALACEAILSTSIAPARPGEARLFQIGKDTLLNEQTTAESLRMRRMEATSTIGTDKLAIQIEENRMTFITQASVGVGHAKGATFVILRNDAELLFAVAADDTLDSFLLNKKNGFAVWTKSRGRFLIDEEPDSQTHYLRCR